MEKFSVHTGLAAPLDLQNVDTDMIIPKQFLKTIKRSGLKEGLFFEMRYTVDGTVVEDFMLNQPAYQTASVLISGENFGCGSSREHAPWALNDFGFRVVIAPSFADIFFNNCFKNGMLPIVLPQDQVSVLMEQAKQARSLTVDLNTQKITLENGETLSFDVEPFRKHCLINGLDDIALTLEKEDKIKAFESTMLEDRPWIAPKLAL